MVTRPNLNSCTKPIFISCRSVLLLGIHWHSLKLYVLQLLWFRSSYKHTHQPSKVIKVSTKGKVQEFITLHFLQIMRVFKRISGEIKKTTRNYNVLIKNIWVSSITTCCERKFGLWVITPKIEITFIIYMYYNKCNQLKDFSMYIL